MLVTVAVCTWNRAALLDRTLAGMTALRVPPGVDWELVVVNNNSTDSTEAVLDRYADRLPLRRAVETKQGHSHARNRAVEHARGDLILWTDDDVLVDPDWLAEYARAAAAFPDADYFGGPIDPWFAAEPPRGLRENLPKVGGAYVLRDFGPGVRPLAADEFPFGASMAFRAAVQKAYRYDPRLGRVKAGLVGADEVAFLERLKAAGRPGVWVGTARLRHYIPPDRATWEYVWRFYKGVGQTLARREGIRACPLALGRPRWLLVKLWKDRAAAFAGRLLGRPGWVDRYVAAAQAAGMLDEYRAYRQAHPAPPAGGYLLPPLEVAA